MIHSFVAVFHQKSIIFYLYNDDQNYTGRKPVGNHRSCTGYCLLCYIMNQRVNGLKMYFNNFSVISVVLALCLSVPAGVHAHKMQLSLKQHAKDTRDDTTSRHWTNQSCFFSLVSQCWVKYSMTATCSICKVSGMTCAGFGPWSPDFEASV